VKLRLGCRAVEEMALQVVPDAFKNVQALAMPQTVMTQTVMPLESELRGAYSYLCGNIWNIPSEAKSTMRSKAGTILFGILLAAALLFATPILAAGYKGIYVGQAVAELPESLHVFVTYLEGDYQGTWFRIDVLNGKVLGFYVIYSGKSLDRTTVIAQNLTLARAIKLHSLQAGMPVPHLGYAVDREGKTYGLADMQNRIVYRVAPVAADSLVESVFYGNETAPVFEWAQRHLLNEQKAPALLSAARSAVPAVERPTGIINVEAVSKASGDATAQNKSAAEPQMRVVVSGPFGLRRGMTQEQVIQVVGKGAVKEAKDDTLELLTVPKPHPAFEFYQLIFSPTGGLLKIIAYGNDITTNGFGERVHDSFIEIRDAISEVYGQPEGTLDFLKAGSIWNEPEYWMMGLLKEERTLATNWQKALPNRIYGIVLDAKALSTEKGFLHLVYEFDGWNEYVDAKKAKAGTVF
jgi:hypothetical protein